MWGEKKVILITFKLLNDGYVDLRVLIYDLKPVFYIRLYTYAFELCLGEQFIEKSSFFFRPEKPACKAGIKLTQARHKALGF